MRNVTHEPAIKNAPISNTRWDALLDQLSYFSVTLNNDAVALELLKNNRPIVIVGAGPSGQELASQLLLHSNKNIILINGEPYLPYMRAQISSCIAEGKSLHALMASKRVQTDTNRFLTINSAVVTEIDRTMRSISLNNGVSLNYDALVLATGSTPTALDIFSESKTRVLSFRDLKDIEKLVSLSPTHVVVVGGGLLGIEAARAVRPFCDHVQILERYPHLLPKQLDFTAATRLQILLQEMGIEVITNAKIAKATEHPHHVSISLAEHEPVNADVVIYATGVTPNIALAKTNGLEVDRAIRVDGNYRTSDPYIYAIGECCEQDGLIHASLSPCVRHAHQLASVLAGSKTASNTRVDLFQLKISHRTVAAIGNTKAIDGRQFIYENTAGAYRRIFVENNVIVGALMFDASDSDFSSLVQAVELGLEVDLSQLDLFCANGSINLPSACSNNTICYCAQVSAERIKHLSAQQYSRTDIIQLTGASSYCGSCAPRLDELLTQTSKDKSRPVIQASILLTLLILTLAALGLSTPLADSWQSMYRNLDVLWRDSVVRQITGYLLFAAIIFSAWWGMRRRSKRLTNAPSKLTLKGHAFIAATAVVIWFAHTGGRMGYELNFWLFLSFAAVLIVGAASATLWILAAKKDKARVALPWLRQLHWLALFPLPALLLFHIIKTYYF